MSNTDQTEPGQSQESISDRRDEQEPLPEVDLSLAGAASVPISSRPGLVPIFGLGLLVMSVGFYFALQRANTATSLRASDGPELSKQWAQKSAPEHFSSISTREVHPPATPVTLPPLNMATAHTYDYTMVQALDATGSAQDASKRPDVRTLLAMRAHLSPMSEARDRDVKIEDLSLHILSSQDAFAARLTDQLATRLEGSSFKMRVHRTGVPEGVVWDDGAHLKLEPLLKLMESGVMLLSISLPARPVMPQEQWSYTLPLTGLELDGVELDGKLLVEASLRGNTASDQSGAQLIVQKFEVRLQGMLPGEVDGVASKMSYQLEGEGEGALLLDVSKGIVTSQEMKLMLDLTLDASSSAGEQNLSRKSTLLLGRTLVP